MWGSKDKQKAGFKLFNQRTRRHCHLCVYEQTCARKHSALASGEMHSVRSTHAA
jgi:hypothetical protein